MFKVNDVDYGRMLNNSPCQLDGKVLRQKPKMTEQQREEFNRMKERYRLQNKFITQPVVSEIEKILASGDRVELIPCKDCVKIIHIKRREVIPGGKRSGG